MSIYNLQTGVLVSNLLSTVSDGIILAGFQLQTGVGDSQSPFLDGDWSPDGKQLVFNVTVQKNGNKGVVIFTSNSDGSSIIAKTDLLSVNPSFSNNLNYSQTNPKWL